MSRIKQFGFLLFVLLLSNCNKEEPGESVFINVNDDFYIDIFEDISNGENLFYITIQSIQDQNCQNAIIDYSLSIIEDQITLFINDILEPGDCISGSAPASAVINLGRLELDHYHIAINLKDVIVNQGNLFVSQNDYFLKMNSKDGFELLHERLNKIPEKSIWGYVGYEADSDLAEAENFLKDLSDMSVNVSDLPATYRTGFYGYFDLLEDESIELREDIEDKSFNTFLFYYDGENQAIIDLLDTYCSSNPEMSFQVFNGEGEVMTCQ